MGRAQRSLSEPRGVTSLSATRSTASPRTTLRVTSFPAPIPENPYQKLLYQALRNYDVQLVTTDRLCVGWLWRSRNRVDVLHFHWPTPYYRHDRGWVRLRPTLSWVRLVLFGLRLTAARSLGYRIIWTVHELDPHETTSQKLDHAAAGILARFSNRLVAHDNATRDAVEAALKFARQRLVLIPHATFAGVYAAGRNRRSVRMELEVAETDLLLLCFGHIREYKDIDVLVAAFERVRSSRAKLVIAGLPLSEEAADILRTAASHDGRITLQLGYVPDERVAELFAASDVAVVSRGDGGTSGVLVLALSLGVPVVAAACDAYEELTRRGDAGWHFRPGDPGSLADLLQRLAEAPEEVTAKRLRAASSGVSTQWDDVARLTDAVYRDS